MMFFLVQDVFLNFIYIGLADAKGGITGLPLHCTKSAFVIPPAAKTLDCSYKISYALIFGKIAEDMDMIVCAAYNNALALRLVDDTCQVGPNLVVDEFLSIT